jgi:hypothetical protein
MSRTGVGKGGKAGVWCDFVAWCGMVWYGMVYSIQIYEMRI